MSSTSLTQEELLKLLQSSDITAGEGGSAIFVDQLSLSTIQGGNSVLYKAKLKNFPTDLAVKLCLPMHRDTEHLTEFGLSVTSATKQKVDLLALQQIFSDNTDYGVPAVYDVLTDQGILVSEWIEGHSLREALLDWRLVPGKKLELIERAGVWMRHYHDSQSLEEGHLDCDSILQTLRGDADQLGTEFSTNPVIRAAIENLELTAPRVSKLNIPRAWVQGDVHSGNIMISGSRICGIDIAISFENVIVRDLAPFLNQMVLLSYRPEGIHLLPWRERMVEAFLRGYCQDGSTVSPLALTWMRLSSLLIVWMDQQGGWHSRLKRLYFTLVFRNQAERLTTQLQTFWPASGAR